MKVKELKEILDKLPEDLDVRVWDLGVGDMVDIKTVEEYDEYIVLEP